jgi:hypothetical protein
MGQNSNVNSTDQQVRRIDEYPTNYIENLIMTYQTGTTLLVQDGSCRDSTDSFDMELTGAPLNNNAVNGVNGLDVGAIANNTWYYLHVIAAIDGSSVTATLLSLSAGAPTLPAGYDIFRRIGVVRVNNVGSYLKFWQAWTGIDRFYRYDEEINLAGTNDIRVLFNGSAIVFTAVSCVTAIPPVSRLAYLHTFLTSLNEPAASTHAWIRENGSGLTFPPYKITCNSEKGFTCWGFCPTDANQVIEYKCPSADDLTIDAAGFVDSLV